MTWLSSPLIIRLFPYLDYHESVILQKTSLKGLILIIKSTYQGWYHSLIKTSPYQCAAEGIDPMDSPHTRIQCIGPLKWIHTQNQQATACWRPQEHTSQDLLSSHRYNDRGVSLTECDLRHQRILPPPRVILNQDYIRSLVPVRGITQPSIPPPLHWCEEKCVETSSQESWIFFPFQFVFKI